MPRIWFQKDTFHNAVWRACCMTCYPQGFILSMRLFQAVLAGWAEVVVLG